MLQLDLNAIIVRVLSKVVKFVLTLRLNERVLTFLKI